MPYLFTSESVSEGHPDKVADQISDALIDYFLAYDPNSKVACETLVTTGQVVLAGEVKSEAYLDVQDIAREVIRKVAEDLGVTWVERDITQSAEDMREYWEKIPVTLVDGMQHDFWRVSEDRLRAALGAAKR